MKRKGGSCQSRTIDISSTFLEFSYIYFEISLNIIYYYFEIPENFTFIATQPSCHEPDYPLSEKIISAYIENGTIETGRIAKGIDDIEANDILALRDALE